MPKSRDLNIDKTIFDVVGNTRAPRLEPETGWYKVGISETYGIGFTNSWGNAGFVSGVTHAPAGWYLADDGEVRLRGVIDGGTADTAAFNLPEEVRPEYAQTFICAIIGGGRANVRIEVNGNVFVESIN